MVVHAYFMAVLVAAAIGGADAPARTDWGLPASANPFLVDVKQVCVVLATQEMPQVQGLIDASKLKARISERLGEAGIAVVERDAETTDRLVVHIEGVEVTDCDKYVYRVQTALGRLVTAPGVESRRVMAEVWHARPVMELGAKTNAGEAISAAVLVQAEVFAAACKAARRLEVLTESVRKETPAAGTVSQTQSSPENLQTATAYPFVASKSSDVFHRADCRWAQNISSDNRVGYQTREEAVQSGKRPCKSCQP